MNDSPYLSQLEKNVEQLLTEKKYREAHDLCKAAKLKHEDEGGIRRIKNDIEKRAKKENEILVDNKIEALKDLEKKGDFAKIIKELKQLRLLGVRQNKIDALTETNKKKYTKQIKKLQNEYIEKQESRLKKLLFHNEAEFLHDVEMLEKQSYQKRDVMQMLQEMRNIYVRKKIKDKSDLLNSDKNSEIRNLLESLRMISPETKELVSLEKKLSSQTLKKQNEEKSEFVFSGRTEIEKLIKFKKYDKAIMAGKEVLALDENAQGIKKLIEIAKNEFFLQTKEITIDSIEKNANLLKKKYKQNESEYVKI